MVAIGAARIAAVGLAGGVALGVQGFAHASSLIRPTGATPHKIVHMVEGGDNYIFQSPRLKVNSGTRITWENNTQDQEHNVTSDTKTWTYAKTVQFGGKVSYTFKKPGVYKYECTLHPGMIGQITVVKKK